MKHLSDEQLEALLDGDEAGDAHLRECDECRRRLSNMRAVRDRLRAAFSSVAPPPGLEDRIRRLPRIAEGRTTPAKPRLRAPMYLIEIWPALPAAAAVLVVGVIVLVWVLTQAPTATAATAELVRIHDANVSAAGGFHKESDPEKVLAYMADHGCSDAAKPSPCKCASLVGCNVADFRGHKAATYCVDTPTGKVSIVVVRETPDELGLSAFGNRNGLDVRSGTYERTNVAATRAGHLTYCAVGALSREALADVLTWAVPAASLPARPTHACPFCAE